MTEENTNTVTSTQLNDMDSTIISDAISDLNDLCERDRVKPGIQSILKDIADNLAGIVPVKTMSHVRWDDKKHTLRQATYIDPDTNDTKEVIMLLFNKNRNYITFLDIDGQAIHYALPENLIPEDKQYTI